MASTCFGIFYVLCVGYVLMLWNCPSFCNTCIILYTW